MRLLRDPRWYRLALGVCVAAISYLALAPLPAPALGAYDKPQHLFAFFVLAWLAAGAYPGRRAAGWRIGLLLGYGVSIELVQHFLPHRRFSVADIAADVAGVLLLLLLAHWFPGMVPGAGHASGRAVKNC